MISACFGVVACGGVESYDPKGGKGPLYVVQSENAEVEVEVEMEMEVEMDVRVEVQMEEGRATQHHPGPEK